MLPEVTNLWRVSVGNINWSKVFLGGIASGVVLLAFDMAGMAVLGFDMKAWAESHNLVTEPNMAVWVVSVLVLGIMLVWLYAAIRPRFGPGVKTAAIAAAFMWLFFSVMFAGHTSMGLYTTEQFVKFAAWGALQMLAASYVGAWLYKEDVGDRSVV